MPLILVSRSIRVRSGFPFALKCPIPRAAQGRLMSSTTDVHLDAVDALAANTHRFQETQASYNAQFKPLSFVIQDYDPHSEMARVVVAAARGDERFVGPDVPAHEVAGLGEELERVIADVEAGGGVQWMLEFAGGRERLLRGLRRLAGKCKGQAMR